jgi:hypothetical protein
MKTRTKLFITLVIIGYMGLFTFNCSAQSYKLDANNKVIQVVKDTTKKADKVHSVVNGITFYQGSKGGVYFWKVSKKTGKKYKVYMTRVDKKETSKVY